MTQKDKLIATSEMLIRKPVHEVFEALANPEITSKFWFTEGSSKLEAGKTVEWTWGQFGFAATIHVTEMKEHQLIQFQWPSGENESDVRTVDIYFEPKPDKTTFVRVVERGFDSKNAHLIEEIAGQTEGWALVLSNMKAFLEFGINLNLINDHKPNE
ncbi:SRPBCC domain-containing protein [Rhodohalobacter sp. 614A]|uniref:SRPBCC domain-containing protein n=1 Tax=Rhodohalobacter sp. 614A TaxID=2908649 RepID=UPI001F431FEF